MEFSNAEKSLLKFPASGPVSECGKFSSLLSDGRFSTILESFIREAFHDNPSFLADVCNVADMCQFLQSSIENFVINVADHNYDAIDLLAVGVSFLYYFIQLNWTGPENDIDTDYYLRFVMKCEDSQLSKLNETKKAVSNYLSTGDEFINLNTRQPLLLVLAELIFRACETFKSHKWWLMRSLYIHQSLLSDPSPSLHKELISLAEDLQNVNTTDDGLIKVMLNLEIIQIKVQLYSEVSKSQTLLDLVCKQLHLEANLVGALGKRTRFQERDIAQLTLKITTESESETETTVSEVYSTSFPKDLRLDDEIRLPEVQFTDENVKNEPNLSGIQEAAILALFVLLKKSKPKDTLQLEELSPYLNCLLSQPKVWCLQLSSLLFRSQLEAECSRTIERSITQIQSLITDFESEKPIPVERIAFVFCSYASPKWALDLNLAKLLVEVGAIQSALDMYLNLQMWEEIVACYNFLKLRHKAAEVIRNEMNKQETPYLWCLLGDATDDEKCYRKAWELSSCKSSRAQKHWALFYYYKKRYQESISHFQKSLEINSLQPQLWFSLGFAAMHEENWEVSAAAYRRYCSLEPECFEAWNNLAKVLVKLGQKERAWRALQEAVKCNFDNWRVWDNLMVVSTDVADFEEVIRCYHRILDLKGKHADEEVLTILVKAIETNKVRCDINILRKQSLQLFGRLTSQVLNNAEIWKLYAYLVNTLEGKSSEDYMKIIQNFQKAHRFATQEPNWEASIEQCKKIISLSIELADAQMTYNSISPSEMAKQQLNSAKLMLRRTTAAVKKTHSDIISQEVNTALAEDVRNLERKLGIVEEKLQLA